MMITGTQAWELFFLLCAILTAAMMGAYTIGILVGQRRARTDQDDPEYWPCSPPPDSPDLTVHLAHVAPSTAQLFRQLEQEAGYDTTPLGQLVQPRRHHQYGQERTTDIIARLTADTDTYITNIQGQPR